MFAYFATRRTAPLTLKSQHMLNRARRHRRCTHELRRGASGTLQHYLHTTQPHVYVHTTSCDSHSDAQRGKMCAHRFAVGRRRSLVGNRRTALAAAFSCEPRLRPNRRTPQNSVDCPSRVIVEVVRIVGYTIIHVKHRLCSRQVLT